LINSEWFSKMYVLHHHWLGCTLKHMVVSLHCGQVISNAFPRWDMRLKLLNIKCVVFIAKCYQCSTSATGEYAGNLLMIRGKLRPVFSVKCCLTLRLSANGNYWPANQKGNNIYGDQTLPNLLNSTRKHLTSHTGNIFA
jgi:hypothetical protein